MQQLSKGMDVWTAEFTNYRIPRAYNLRSDPFERADESGRPFETSNQLYYIVPAQAVVARHAIVADAVRDGARPPAFGRARRLGTVRASTNQAQS